MVFSVLVSIICPGLSRGVDNVTWQLLSVSSRKTVLGAPVLHFLTHHFIHWWSSSARAARHSPPTGARRHGNRSAPQPVSDAFEAATAF